jgi:hypothetical protein
MIRRAVMFLAVCGLCFASMADAADLPFYTAKKTTSAVKKTPKPHKVVVKTPRIAAVEPAKTKIKLETPKRALQPTGSEMNLVWVLDPLVANSDGAKREDSASVEANLVVTEPGSVLQSEMIIELSGHIVKTIGTTARLDVRIGNSHRTVSWSTDDVQSGKFKISLNEVIAAGKLPDYFPVSALAFATKDGKQGAAMVSLEKVVLRVGKVQAVATQKDPATNEVTGSISNN